MCSLIDKKTQELNAQRQKAISDIEAHLSDYQKTDESAFIDIQVLLCEISRLRLHLERINSLACTGVQLRIDQQAPIALEARQALGYDDFTPTYLLKYKKNSDNG